MSAELHLGDCLDVLKTLPSESVHSVVTDPPAGIGLLELEWDSDKGGRQRWIAWLRDIMVECRRVLKPGGHALVWAYPRTSHWTATAIEDAGLEIRHVVTHIFRGGVPASTALGTKVDRALGATPHVVGYQRNPQSSYFQGRKVKAQAPKLEPSSAEGRRWQRWGLSLKPATEHWILARKPMSERNAALNLLKHETGALNIGGCRVGSEGRYPSTMLLSHAPECDADVCAATCPVLDLEAHGSLSELGEEFTTFYFSGKTRKQERSEGIA